MSSKPCRPSRQGLLIFEVWILIVDFLRGKRPLPLYHAPQVRSSPQRKLFFTSCRRQILHHGTSRFPSPILLATGEPNSKPRLGAVAQ